MFHTMFTQEVAALARKTRSAITLRVFLVLPDHLDHTVYRRLNGEKLGAELGVDQASISRAMRELHELGAVDRRGKSCATEWKLTPDYTWRGDVSSYHAEQRKRHSKAPPPAQANGLKSHNGYDGKPVVADATKNKAATAPRQRSLTLLAPIPGRQ